MIISPIQGEDSIYTSPTAIPNLTPVYIVEADTIAVAMASIASKIPAVGLVVSSSGTTYNVRSNGELDGFEDLDPGKMYYLSNEGSIWTPSLGGEWPDNIQPIGTAKNTTTLLIQIAASVPIVS